MEERLEGGADAGATSVRPADDDAALLDALRRGDESAFARLIDLYHPAMVRTAMFFVRTRPAAEDVAQETWLAVVRGLKGFDGRSSLKTWIFAILINRAKTHGAREDRYVPLAMSTQSDAEVDEPSLDPDRFNPDDHPRYPGGWVSFPPSWHEIPEERLLSRETFATIQRAIEGLPPRQRLVIALRDVEGWTSDEVCNAVDICETNQRVLLHRARSKVRSALETYLQD
jgi:RNA polymerase sigma-70 factor (ECF subfamily)